MLHWLLHYGASLIIFCNAFTVILTYICFVCVWCAFIYYFILILHGLQRNSQVLFNILAYVMLQKLCVSLVKFENYFTFVFLINCCDINELIRNSSTLLFTVTKFNTLYIFKIFDKFNVLNWYINNIIFSSISYI